MHAAIIGHHSKQSRDRWAVDGSRAIALERFLEIRCQRNCSKDEFVAAQTMNRYVKECGTMRSFSTIKLEFC